MEGAIESTQLWQIPTCNKSELWLFLNGPTPASIFVSFQSFQSNIVQFLQQINVKNIYTVYGAEIQTHDLRNISLLP